MEPILELTPDRVAEERDRIRQRADRIVPLINDVRGELGDQFGIDVEPVGRKAYHREVDSVFADGDLAVNVAALAWLLRGLDVEGDYPGFVVDELLGRELAATIAGTQPLRTLGEATFHYTDIHVHSAPERTAGADDLEAALAAGFGERLPGWGWPDRESPFAVE